MNLIGPSEMLQDVKDQSDSFYISYVRQVARKSKNMNLLAEFSWIFSMETAESEVQYNIEHMCKADGNNKNGLYRAYLSWMKLPKKVKNKPYGTQNGRALLRKWKFAALDQILSAQKINASRQTDVACVKEP